MRFARRYLNSRERKTPLKIELASTTEVDKFEDIAPDFFERILEMDRNDCLMTDESSLWDFHSEMSNESFVSRILDVYGVDVSDMEKANLAKIFHRIKEAQAAKE